MIDAAKNLELAQLGGLQPWWKFASRGGEVEGGSQMDCTRARVAYSPPKIFGMHNFNLDC